MPKNEKTDRCCPECGNAMTKLPRFNGEKRRVWKCQYCGRPVVALFRGYQDGRGRLIGLEPVQPAGCR